jgi:hypothetical protein
MSGGPNVAALDGQISVPWRRIAPVVAEMSPAAAVLGRETVGGVVVGGTVVELVLANSPWSRGTPSFGTPRSDRSCPTVAG